MTRYKMADVEPVTFLGDLGDMEDPGLVPLTDTELRVKKIMDNWRPEFAGMGMQDIERLVDRDLQAERRDKKKHNKRKMVVDGAGLKSVTIVVKHKKGKK